MRKLPEKRIEGSLRKALLPVAILWIIIFPLVCLLTYLLFYGLNRGENISSIILPNLILIVFLFGITYLTIRLRQSLVLIHVSIKFIRRDKVKEIAWSDVSRIGTGSYKGVRFVRLFLKQWQQQKEALEGLEKWMLIWNDLWIARSYVQIPSTYLKISHKELLSLVETYFEQSKA